MSRNKETKAKRDRHSRLMESCQDCMARLIKYGSSLESAIAACRDLAMEKVFSKKSAEIMK